LSSGGDVRTSAGRLLFGVLDALILAGLAITVAILITGGGAFEFAGIRLRARTVDNPLLILAAAVMLRYAAGRAFPLLGIRRLTIVAVSDPVNRAVFEEIPARITRLFATPVPALAVIALGVFTVKALLAWGLPGFFSGDDVEIHQMTIGALYGKHWPVWELRSAFFPMVFIYPAQRTAAALGAVSPETLVLAGRLVVAFLSSAVIPLTWLAVRRVAPADPRLAALTVLFVAVNKLMMSFGSSELPRPVSTLFVVGAFVSVLSPRMSAPAAAGGLLGVAAAFRFSEFVFVPVALFTLPRDRYLLRASSLVMAAGAALAAITAAADYAYWGSPFSSLATAVDYTLVHGESSRGYQPPWEYLRLLPSWSTFLVVALALAGSSRRHPDTWWLWVPFALLSLMPHKESRYLIPVVPFLSIAAARGFLRAAAWVRRTAPAPCWRQWTHELFAPMLLLSLLHEAGGWRLARSNEAVRLARYIRPSFPAGLAGQDLWRLGGHPYLWRHDPLVEITPEILQDRGATAAAIEYVRWVALRTRTARTAGDAMLGSLHFERDPAWRGEDYVLYVRREGAETSGR
jgi:hypothetical protein